MAEISCNLDTVLYAEFNETYCIGLFCVLLNFIHRLLLKYLRALLVWGLSFRHSFSDLCYQHFYTKSLIRFLSVIET